MSLKAFHLLFIVIAVVLSLVCATIGWNSYQNTPSTVAIVFGVGFSVLAVVMSFYGAWFLKKSRKIIV